MLSAITECQPTSFTISETMDIIRRRIAESPAPVAEKRSVVAAAAASGDSCEFGR